MHQLPCPHCQTNLHVEPTQAGDSIDCPACGQRVPIPTLRDLRQLPRVEADRATPHHSAPSRLGMGQRVAFGTLGAIALVGLLISGFCWVRWASVEVPITTEGHIDQLQEMYADLTAAELIREYQDIDQFGVDLAAPMTYRVAEMTKNRWKRNALASGGVSAVAILAAAALVLASRRRAAPAQDT